MFLNILCIPFLNNFLGVFYSLSQSRNVSLVSGKGKMGFLDQKHITEHKAEGRGSEAKSGGLSEHVHQHHPLVVLQESEQSL